MEADQQDKDGGIDADQVEKEGGTLTRQDGQSVLVAGEHEGVRWATLPYLHKIHVHLLVRTCGAWT